MAALLVVAGAGLVVASAAWPVLAMRRLSAARQAARSDVSVLTRALEGYVQRAGGLPRPPRSGSSDRVWGGALDNREVMAILLAPAGDGAPRLTIPPAGPGRSGLTPDGDFVDPWGHPYYIALDLSGDGFVDLGGRRSRMSGSIAVWSIGPDGEDDTQDDLVSWRR